MHELTLRQQLEQLSARVSAVEADNHRLKLSEEQLRQENGRLAKENQLLRQKLDHYIRHYFGGARNEGLDRKQMELLLQGLPALVVLSKAQTQPGPQRLKPSTHPVRRVLAEDKLPTIEIVLEPDEVKVEPQGWVKISEERTTVLDWEPGKFLRQIIIRPRYVKNERFALAELPPQPIPQGMVGPGLLAQMMVSKYEHHQPLYRQEKIFKQQYGVELSRKTMGSWVEQAAELLKPIYRAMREGLVKGNYLQADETPIRYLDPDIKGKSQQGWLWVYSRPGGDVVFVWCLSRGAQGPKQLLENFQGKLQTDGYAVYESLAKQREGLLLIGCWAHVRRNFVEAVPENKVAAWFVLQIGLLYRVERQLRQCKAGPALRAAVRLWQSQPVLTRLGAAMRLLRGRVLPQGKLGQALQYALSRWETLIRYVEDGALEIDNNLIENAIRPSALGKKNWLFIGHPTAGERSAVIYSLLGSCRRQGINPFDYLRDLFTRLPAAKITEIQKFTPAAWAKARTKPPPAQQAA
jgi:regulator of replication initiation timing